MLRRIFPSNSEEKSYVHIQQENSFESSNSQEHATLESSFLRSENIATDEKQRILRVIQESHRENVVLRSVLSQLEQENQQLKEQSRYLEKLEIEMEKTKAQNVSYKQRILSLEQQLAEACFAQREAERASQQRSISSFAPSQSRNFATCTLDKEELACENSKLRSELLEKQAIISSLSVKIRSHDISVPTIVERREEANQNGRELCSAVDNREQESSKGIDESYKVEQFPNIKASDLSKVGFKKEEAQGTNSSVPPPPPLPPPPPPPPAPPLVISSNSSGKPSLDKKVFQPGSEANKSSSLEHSPLPPPPPPPPPPFPSSSGVGIDNLKDQVEPKNMSEVANNVAMPTKPVVKPRKPMKFLYWRRVILPPSWQAVECSFWRSVMEISFDRNEFEYLFSKPTNSKVLVPNSGRSHDGKTERKSTIPLSVLDERRTHLVGVLLVSLPSMAVIQRALIEMDDGCLSAKDCNSLLKIFPSSEEQSLLKKAKDTGAFLTHTEEFLYELVQIPFLQIRTKVLLFKREFDERGENILRPLNVIHKAVEAVENSKALKAILGVILSLGNYMNGGTIRGQADGFILDILSKLSDTKAIDNETTFLQYAAHVAYYDAAESRAVVMELKILREASKISLSEVAESLCGLRTELKELSDAVRCLEYDNASTRKLLKYLENFEGYAEKILNKLEELLKKRTNEFQHLVLTFGYSKFEAESLTTCEFFKELHVFVVEIGKLLAREESLERESETQN
ncbi:hypothetical protein GpartN1_g56.t1 [Galdieria partita]|uniref:FH2 domain-containing protein n=1 Tax=Galdieria partita TaxID=83374 RepID=A0A9C7PPR4_9RHOD|nr:hypothetical protein GpartN1_g56.t1 [Galdieria partita]